MTRILLSLLLALLLPAGAHAQFFSLASGGALPDVSETCFPLMVSGLPMRADSTFGLTVVRFNITHPHIGDLRISLRSPSGTVVVLVDQRGGAGDNFIDTEMRMGARIAVQNGFAPFTGHYRPEESLNRFNDGQNPNGMWQFCVNDLVPSDVGVLNSLRLTFGANPPPDPVLPCSLTNPRGCRCEDATQIVCDLLPDMTASGDIMTAQHTEVPGALSISNATPNIGWGPMEIHGSGECYCDTVQVSCTTTLCPDGNPPKEQVLQTIYRKVRIDSIASYTRRGGYMSYHPTHGHIHVDHWGEFSLRLRGPLNDPLTWPIVAEGAKISFCLLNLGDCTSRPGYCRDSAGAVITRADIPNAGFGQVTGCGTDQGIFTGHLDIYDQNLPGMTINLPNVCNGSYWLVSTTDPNNDFLESDETNNSVAVPITLTQQLTRPSPAFTYSQVSGQYVFSGTGLPAAARFRWDFHDGSPPDSVNNPTVHQFTTAGVHTVTFTVISPCGTDSASQTFTVLGTAADLAAARFGLRVAPNPTAGTATLHYALPVPVQTAAVEVYDLLGKRVARTALGAQPAGTHTAPLDLGAGLPQGIYVAWLRTEKGAQAVRVVKN